MKKLVSLAILSGILCGQITVLILINPVKSIRRIPTRTHSGGVRAIPLQSHAYKNGELILDLRGQHGNVN